MLFTDTLIRKHQESTAILLTTTLLGYSSTKQFDYELEISITHRNRERII